MKYKITLQQTSFHTIEIDENGVLEATEKAFYYINKFPGTAKINKREFVLWNVENND